MKKLISILVTLSVLMTSICFALPASAGVSISEIYVDVSDDAWYAEAVDFVTAYEIMGGAGSNNTFKPADLSTRSMIAVILHRIEGEPAATKASPFTDLTQDWYIPAVKWAYESGVVKGSSETTFNPDGNITRQEIMTMLYRYAQYKKLDVAADGDISGFSDKGDVASWASDAVKWAVGADVVGGRNEGGKVLLAPLGNTQRCEMATLFMRFCVKYDVFNENSETPEKPAVMSLEEVLADIKSDRVKKVIFDADAGNEFDDQYALAYALSSDSMNIVSINASQFLNTALVPDREAGMMKGYDEIKEVLALLGREDIPVYKGVGVSVTKPDDGGIGYPEVIPVDAEAVDNIINTVKTSDEIVYVMTTGCATNIACAIAKDPSIKDNMCVVWMGSNHYDWGGAGEFNMGQDETAARYMMNSGVKIVWVPASSRDSTKGSQVLKTGRKFLEESFPGDDPISKCFGGEMAGGHDSGFYEDPENWWHIFWDVAAPAIFDTPELCELQITTLLRVRGDGTFDDNKKDRPNCIVLNKLKNPQTVLDNMAAGINTFVK